MSKAPKKLSNCLKRTETIVVFIVFDCVLCEVSTMLLLFLTVAQHESGTRKLYLFNNQINRQTSGESASLPQSLGCNTVFDMRLRVTFLRRKTVSFQSNIAHRE